MESESLPHPAAVVRVTHAASEITAELVRDLLRDQHPVIHR